MQLLRPPPLPPSFFLSPSLSRGRPALPRYIVGRLCGLTSRAETGLAESPSRPSRVKRRALRKAARSKKSRIAMSGKDYIYTYIVGRLCGITSRAERGMRRSKPHRTCEGVCAGGFARKPRPAPLNKICSTKVKGGARCYLKIEAGTGRQARLDAANQR